MAMSWYEHWIRRYEHRRWTTDDNRMVRPFEWGVEHLEGKSQNGDNPRGLLREYSRAAVERSAEWYADEEVRDYRLDGDDVLAFTSAVKSPWPENNTVFGQFFPAGKNGPAVLVVPNWNEK